MCGIVGYVGKLNALEVVISGLEKLEYRGYDSAGVATVIDKKIEVRRAVGKLANLKNQIEQNPLSGKPNIAIGHTRWATHGKPSEDNAHPHTAGRVSIIHNGIIENYLDLKKELIAAGSVFKSETDTECAAHLLNQELANGADPFLALQKTCARIRGSYSFLAIDSQNPDQILIAKTATPIIIGIGDGEVFVASDIPAVLPYTKKIMVLEDGDIARVTTDGSIYIENNGIETKRPTQTITWDPVTAQKGGFKHFMLKEIHDQAQSSMDTFRGRLEQDHTKVFLPELSLSDKEIKDLQRVVFVACGTAWHAGLVGKFFFEQFAGLSCEVDYASEFRYRNLVLDEKTLVIAISQSGETADTLAAIEVSLGKAKVAAICNVLGSTLARKVKDTIFTHAGPEISVASTKAFTTQLIATLLLALKLGEVRGKVTPARIAEVADSLIRLPNAIEEVLKTTDSDIEKIAKNFYRAKDFLFLGRGLCFPIALEGALKLKEISYIHAEGYPAGEIKHGPLALIDEEMPVVMVVHKSSIIEKTLSNLKEVESRGAKLIVVTDAQLPSGSLSENTVVVHVPFIGETVAPILLNIPLQLLAYHVAVHNGTDVDLPRNLAKSVTVE